MFGFPLIFKKISINTLSDELMYVKVWQCTVQIGELIIFTLKND